MLSTLLRLIQPITLRGLLSVRQPSHQINVTNDSQQWEKILVTVSEWQRFRTKKLTAITYWTVSSKPPICWITQFFHCLRTFYVIIFGESFSVTVPSGKKKVLKKLLGKILIDHALIFKNFKFDIFHAILLIINLSNSWWMMYFSPLFKELWDYSLKVTCHIQ